ncbi:MAG: hypothetical protein M3176_14455 [Chloroflexota bacterium]|nr:hypothetical protein [Chloroflexota bacterium]
MYNQGPGSLRGDDRVDLAGPNRMLERARNRAQDHYTGDEEAVRGEAAAAEAAKERKDATRRAREGTTASLGERIHGWWSHRFHRG